MHTALALVGYWAGGFFVSQYAIKRIAGLTQISVTGTCPKALKCWIGSVASLVFGGGCYFYCGLRFCPPGPEFLISWLVASVVGGALALAFCPLPM
jgi:hypothetical protein